MDMHPLHDWIWVAVTALGAMAAVLFAYILLRPVARRLLGRSPVATAVNRQIDSPLHWLLPLIALQLALEGAPDDLFWIGGLRHTVGILVIAAFTWAITAAVRGVA